MKKLIQRSLLFLLSLIASAFVSFWSLPAPAQSDQGVPFVRSQWSFYDCDNPAQEEPTTEPDMVPAVLKTRFPFDLIYPTNPMDLAIDSECLQTSLWGIEREMCAPKMIATSAKNLFLLKVVLQSLLSL